jgi:hypothetical protein
MAGGETDTFLERWRTLEQKINRQNKIGAETDDMPDGISDIHRQQVNTAVYACGNDADNAKTYQFP